MSRAIVKPHFQVSLISPNPSPPGHRYEQTGPRATPPENLGKIDADQLFLIQIRRKLQLGTRRQAGRMGRFADSRSGTQGEKGKMAEDEGLEPTRPKPPVFKTGALPIMLILPMHNRQAIETVLYRDYGIIFQYRFQHPTP